MSFVALSYPKLNDADFTWIQNHRKFHDKLYFNMVKPHFAIVFPSFNLTIDQFINEIYGKCKNTSPITFKIRSAVVNKDAFIDTYHEFLVPDEGHSDIIKLHDVIYSESLFPELRLDIDYIPHIGIGNSKDPLKCKKNVDEINNSIIEISGIINSIDIAQYDENGIVTIDRLSL